MSKVGRNRLVLRLQKHQEVDDLSNGLLHMDLYLLQVLKHISIRYLHAIDTTPTNHDSDRQKKSLVEAEDKAFLFQNRAMYYQISINMAVNFVLVSVEV